MSSKSGIRSLAAAVGRLERAAGRGSKYCAFCRCMRSAAPRPDAPEEAVLRTDCEFCGSPHAIDLRTSDEELEVARMYFSFTLEDRFTDPKAHALTLWCTYRPGRVETEAVPARDTVRDPLARAGAKLHEDLDILIDRRLGKLRAKYGEPFPEHYRIIEAVEERERANRDASVFAPGLKELRRKRTDYLICCELEKLIWGGARPKTDAAVERVSLEMDELVRSYAEAEDRRREESRVKNTELVNRFRAQQGLPPRPKNHE
jgi:hypothetical protein